LDGRDFEPINAAEIAVVRARFESLRPVLIPASDRANERAVQLKQAPGVEVLEGQCGACHSLDYIVTNSPFLDAGKWDAEVAKMIKAFGAPINPADAKTIGDYLEENYGG
jgi:sulfite dehydrogenase (cytochrome) subunit B